MTGYPAAIIWDLDGTLIDSAPDLADALNALLHEHGEATLGENQVRTMIGNGVARLVERGFAAVGDCLQSAQLQKLVTRFLQLYTAAATNRTCMDPGVQEALQFFADAGVQQGICTNKPEAISKQILADLSIADYFNVVVGGDTVTEKKPNPLPLRTCVTALKSKPGDSMLIGDSAVDVETARALDMPVGIVTHGYSRSPVANLGADFLIDDLSSLPALIGELRAAS